MQTGPVEDSKEIYEGFGDELAELRGLCVVIPAKHNFSEIARTDTILKYLDPMLSPEFSASMTFVEKLQVLFSIKEKWTLGELELYLKDTLEPEHNF